MLNQKNYIANKEILQTIKFALLFHSYFRSLGIPVTFIASYESLPEISIAGQRLVAKIFEI